jgi:hypothetical protein
MTHARLCCIQSACEATRHRLRAAALDARLDRVQRSLEVAEKRLAIRGKGTGAAYDFTSDQARRLLDETLGGEPV